MRKEIELSCFHWRVAWILAGVTPLWANAQTPYPQKSLRIIAGFVPGGFADTSSRIVAQQLTAAWGQQVVVENRPGANGLIASDFTAKALPDGYTLHMSSAGLTINPMLYARQQRDPLRDFTAVSLVAGIPNLLVVHPSVPAKDVGALLAIARGKSVALTQATAGTGSPGHLSGELLQQIAQVKFVHVPYKGSVPALIDIVGGNIDLSFPSISSSVALVKARKLRGVGVTMKKRSPLLPEVPPIADSVPGYEVVGWYGLVGPAGMAADVTAKISTEVARMLGAPEVRERFLREGAEPIGGSPESFSAFLAQDQVKWAKVIKAAGIRPSE
jgi:tripartite-type tricarboxylate transporter receptor subunit TctC